MENIYYIQDLEQLRVLSDPLRVKILWSFNGKEKTGKMLADEFQMAPSKIRYHLTELERVGLVEVVRTELKNGIQQKFYLPVAETFSLEKMASLLNGEDVSQLDDAIKESAFLSLEELRQKLTEAKLRKHEMIQIPYTVRLTKEEKRAVADKLMDIYQLLKRASKRRTDEPVEECYLNLTMFPME
ncbi:helix-turn-helix domain-containing protein [Sporolactobacillus sp. Y61]|uniref:Helix-turn-helix domain-containing protein n=1 Tax=Sporolactobacillus sp. Y61 TaxID=3160863 RepID=A0AAU8ID81_9BACL|nr:helix-turn-helix domain-containing protein [Sporolactobacillus sp. THM19-2]RYL92174.1 ArsR family transcriptional regulator [Sporolactobacillus sp. THM19-2]